MIFLSLLTSILYLQFMKTEDESTSLAVDCPGSTEIPTVYNSNIEIRNIRVCCSYGNHEYHVVLQWSNPSFTNKTVRSLIVSFISPSEIGCYRLHNNTTEFEFTTKKGYNSESSFVFSIFTEPIAYNTSRPSYQLSLEDKPCGPSNVGDCNDVKSINFAPLEVSSRIFIFSNEVQIIILVFLSLITFGALFWAVFKIRTRYDRKKNLVPRNEEQEKVVYISHCALSNSDIEKVQNLAAQINCIQNVHVCIDLCNQISINECGGLSVWVPEHLEKADKIIMVLSPLYLEAITLREPTDDIFCKVNAEVVLIRNMLYRNCQRSSQFAVLLDGVNNEEAPTEFVGRLFGFPCTYDDNDQNWLTLLGFVLNKNTFYFEPTSSSI